MGSLSQEELRGRGAFPHAYLQPPEGPWGSGCHMRQGEACGRRASHGERHTLDLAAVTGAAAGGR